MNRTHIFGHGLDDKRYLIERSQSLATGDIRPCRDNRQSKKGWRKEPRKVMSLRAAQRMRPKRNGVIFCACVAPGSDSRATVRSMYSGKNRRLVCFVISSLQVGTQFTAWSGIREQRHSLDDAGIRTTGVIRCDQPRVLDLAARNGKRLETVPEPIMDEVLARLTILA